jgi:hypothetical protein
MTGFGNTSGINVAKGSKKEDKIINVSVGHILTHSVGQVIETVIPHVLVFHTN